MDLKTLLLTGFEPFGGQTINPSAELIRDLSWASALLGKNWKIVTALIPVDYNTAWQTLEQKIGEFRPERIVCLGQAGGRKNIAVERIAINWMEDRSDQAHADHENPQTVSRKILQNGPDGLFATLPVEFMVSRAEIANAPVEISNSAGTYLCNYLMYRLLESQRTTSRECGFIHVPYLPGQVATLPLKQPSLTLKEMQNALAQLLV